MNLKDFRNIHQNDSYLFNEDIIGLFLPLFKRLTTIHDEDKVANIRYLDNLSVEDFELKINEEQPTEPEKNLAKIEELNKSISFLEITEHVKLSFEVGEGNSSYDSDDFNVEQEEIKRPVYLLGYRSYEQYFGHYDQKTELFICGLLMASFAFNLDFTSADDVKQFVENRHSLYALNRNIHPAILLIIQQLTDLDRNKRTRETRELIWKLENYKEYNTDYEEDILTTEGYKQQNNSTRNSWVLHKLKSRLFEISRRNKLLYFKSTSKFLNLTIASVPTILYYEKIQEKDLFLWNEDISSTIKKQGKIALNKYLRLEESRYISATLENIRSDARKDLYEYGFTQLKLVLAFLNWYNFKENKSEKINSPLLILPVTLTKKKGVTDTFELTCNSSEAEINPVLKHHLKELFDINLPESINLEKIGLSDFYENIKKQIEGKNHELQLSYIDRPRIRLIQSIAKKKNASYNKRTRYRTTEFNTSKFDYSYNKDQYKPLGLEIFKDYVRPSISHLEYIINDDINYTEDSFSAEKTRNLYSIDLHGNYNPYNWEFDICNMTLGNFNYKKMSLVRDYNTILENPDTNQVFTKLFSDEPKELTYENETLPTFEDNFYILNADATQARAISKAKTGKSIIIQGPPGTGKSQTITNLIADFASNNKRILFVCEKRAALDVVYARLKSKKLHYLTSLVHDSQSDKKEFIMDAKATYEKFIEEKDSFKSLKKERDNIISEMKKEIEKINQYHNILTSEFKEIGMAFFKFIDQIIEFRTKNPTEIAVNPQLNFVMWNESQSVLSDLSNALKSIGLNSEPTKYSLKTIPSESLSEQEKISKSIQSVQQSLEKWLSGVQQNSLNDIPQLQLKKLLVYAQLSELLLQLKPVNKQQIFDEYSSENLELKRMISEIEKAKDKINKTIEINKNWTSKLSNSDASSAFEQLENLEGKFYASILPKYRKLKKIMHQSYNFEAHQVKPKMTKVLSELLEEYKAKHHLEEIEEKANTEFNTQNFEELRQKVISFQQNEKDSIAKVQEFNVRQLETLKSIKSEIPNFEQNADFIGIYKDNKVIEIKKQVSEMEQQLNTLSVVTPYLQAFLKLPLPVQQQLKSNTDLLSENEQSIAEKTLQDLYNSDINIINATGYSLQFSIGQIQKLHHQLLDLNSDFLLETYKSRFKAQLDNSQLLANQQDEQGKIDKKIFNKSRKILENEFNKKIRYKSIRELKTIESSYILDLIKPIWLMSPLSVSDTLPIDPELFDVVIFDEASQITLEEGVPTIFRSNQAIIVGDEMQMPPTNFFSSNTSSNEEDEEENNEDAVVIDAESMLTHATKKLEDVMLSWHYRSKYEGLIGFSNSAFYGGNLLTIPDQEELQHADFDEETPFSERLDNEVISFHFQEDGIYRKRQNTIEANTIAKMVRDLLINKPELSIGIVAFSMQQQDTIETALSNLASKDNNFARLLEEAYTKTEDEQHVGLFVKNLENVQGDERDVIIISVCYGYNEKGKMLMNFGPINRKGGEKRLNVIFSRSKKHMAIVSSIHYHDITNEYNEGANYLRRFLQYAEAVSTGNTELSSQILGSLSPVLEVEQHETSEVTKQIQEYIHGLGYETSLNVGLSQFKISIGVKDKTDPNSYILGVLLDNDNHYQTTDIVDQYVLRPNLLKTFGWKTIQVYKKDWLENKDVILEQIKGALG